MLTKHKNNVPIPAAGFTTEEQTARPRNSARSLRSAKLRYPALRQRIHPPQLRSPLPPLRSSGQQPRPAGCTEVIQTFFVTRRFPIFLTGRQQQRDPFHCGYVPRSVAV